jgi:hypothetical protein
MTPQALISCSSRDLGLRQATPSDRLAMQKVVGSVRKIRYHEGRASRLSDEPVCPVGPKTRSHFHEADRSAKV